MTTKKSSIRLASEGEFQTTSTDSLSEMRAMVAEYESDPNGAVLDGWEPREGTIITEVRAISARINQNFDAWPSEELRTAHHTFVGKPVFVNHNNHDPSRARGRVVASRYVDAGENDRYVQVLQEVEASRFPLLAKELMDGGLDSVSMGAEAREVECSYCGNISTTPFDACQHIPMKGSTLQRRTASGSPENVLIYEICRKISFFELSYVFDPADETAVASRVLVAGTTIEAPPKVDTLHPDEDEKSNDDWHEYVDDPNVIDTIDVLDEPDLGLNQQLERPDDEVPEGFEEFSDIDDQIEENEQAETELAQDARQKSQDKEEAEAAERQRQFEQQVPDEGEASKDPENDDDWDEEEDATGSSHRFKGGSLEIMVANDFGSVNMWVEKDGSLIASDTYPTVNEAKAAAVAVAKQHRAEWAGYSDFADCVQQNSDKEDPDAYCGEVKHRVEKGREGNVLEQGKLAQYEDLPIVPQSNHPGSRKAGSETFGVRDLQNHEDSLGANVREGAHPASRTSDGVRSSQQGTSSGVHEANVLEAETSSHRVSRGRVRSLRDEGPDSALDQSHRRSGRRGHQERAGATPGSPERPERVRPEMYELSETLGVREGGTQASQQRGVSPSSQMVDSVDAYCGEIKHRVEKGRESKMSRNIARRKQAAAIDGWDMNGDHSATFDGPGFQLWVATGNYDDGVESWTEGEWLVSDTSSWTDVASGKAGSVNAAAWAAIVAADEAGFDTSSIPASGNTNASRRTRRTAKGKTMSRRKVAHDYEEIAHRAADDFERDTGNNPYTDPLFITQYLPAWASAHAQHIAFDPDLYDELDMEANMLGYGYTVESRRKHAAQAFTEWMSTAYPGKELLDFSRAERSKILNEYIQEVGEGNEVWSSRNGEAKTSRTNDRDHSRKDTRMARQGRRRSAGDNKQTPLLEDTGIAQTPTEEAPVDVDLDNGSDAPNNSESDRVKSARRALAREIARERAARRRQATFAAGDRVEHTEDGVSGTVVVTDPDSGEVTVDWSDGETSTEPADRLRAASRRKAEAVGADESGDNVDREDLFENYPATTMTARVRNRFASWVQSNYGCDLREASGPGELRSWARSFARKTDIDLATIHSAIKKDIVALRTAADDDDDDDEGVSGDEAKKDDVPDFIEDKIESEGDNPSKDDVSDSDDDDDDKKEAAREAIARVRRRRQAKQAAQRGRRTKTTRRKTADDKLDLAAPDERVNVEKPTSGTTDADAEASQFDKADFDNNSGKGLENPDTTGTPGIPGGPSANDFKRSSARASGLQAVRLAEAMITAGLVEDTTEAKFKAAAEYEKMSRDIVLDRTALLEKVAKVQTARRANSTTKSAGNRGASLNSAVPPNMTGMARSSAPQRRESASANDSDLFL